MWYETVSLKLVKKSAHPSIIFQSKRRLIRWSMVMTMIFVHLVVPLNYWLAKIINSGSAVVFMNSQHLNSIRKTLERFFSPSFQYKSTQFSICSNLNSSFSRHTNWENMYLKFTKTRNKSWAMESLVSSFFLLSFSLKRKSEISRYFN